MTTPSVPSGSASGPAHGPASGPSAAYVAYIASLPRVLAAAATVFRDASGRVLIVEPNYRAGWTLPGGTVEADTGETPRQAARRETAEEIGLDAEPGPLLVVDWVHGAARPPLVAYVYDGGVLADERFAAIRLQEEELDSWKLVERADLAAYLPDALCVRVHAALDALAAGRGPVELEDGRPAR
ncbi:NUDIX domain-containing protein [Streptomyces laurentii]|uniref:NUDIX domain-containing protein n=1 Tax=Streptomyces laurentii TaxID=39478 RepID=UPI00367F50EC